ncbi:hypothetical protein ACFQMM_17620 [Saliphagus sp. GCM10025308]
MTLARTSSDTIAIHIAGQTRSGLPNSSESAARVLATLETITAGEWRLQVKRLRTSR